MSALGCLPPGINRSHRQARGNDPHRGVTLHSVALWCITVVIPAFRSRRQGTCTMRFGVISPFTRLRIGIPLDYSVIHGPYLCRRFMPRPKLSRSRPTTVAAAPATFRLVHLQVVGREQMAIAADTGYGHGPEDTSRR
jgi:hypothetical protein